MACAGMAAFIGCDGSHDSASKGELASAGAVAPAHPPPSPAEPERKVEAPPPWADRVSPTGGFPCAVDRVLAASCRRCHWDPTENDAPFALVNYEDTQNMRSGKLISELMEQMVAADLMPPLSEPVEPKVAPLGAGQKEILLKWLRSGAPKNEGQCR